MRRIPLVPVALSMMAGIVLAHGVSSLTTPLWLILLGTASVAGGLLWTFRSRATATTAVFLAIVFFALGGLLCRIGNPRYDAWHWTHHCPQPAHLELRLTSTPLPRERSWMATTEVESIDNQLCHGTLRLYLRKDTAAATLRYGDRLLVHGYADTAKGWLYCTSDHYLLTGRDSTSLRAHSERLRLRLLHSMQQGPLEHRYAGIVEALTLGWRGDLEDDLTTQFRDAGIMHLLCVSGLHVGLLAAIVGAALFWLGKERRGRIIRGSLQLMAVWSFALLTGLAPATLRAALMFSLFIVSHMLARRTDSLNLLAATAIVMLVADPMLLFNIGWQLSFSAVAGILLVRPLLHSTRNQLVQTALASIAATLATLPIVVSTYHQLPLYFLISNIVILPAAGLLLALALLYAALPCAATAYLVRWPLWFCDGLTGLVSHLPGATLTDLHPTPMVTLLMVAAVVLLLAGIYITFSRHPKEKYILP